MIKVLVVEDDPTLQSAYKTTLELEGFEAAVASNGEEGWQMASSIVPDVILLDMLMPKLDGLQFLRLRQNDDKVKTARVIVFSNLNSPDDIDEALSLGASKYVTKSHLTPKEMVGSIKDVLDGSSSSQS